MRNWKGKIYKFYYYISINFQNYNNFFFFLKKKLIKETIPKYWTGIDFMENVLLVLTVPADFSEVDMAIMRECVYNAGLISNKFSEKLQFTTERTFIFFIC
jgi:hypothetical protein